jgi:hypothetical protein
MRILVERIERKLQGKNKNVFAFIEIRIKLFQKVK